MQCSTHALALGPSNQHMHLVGNHSTLLLFQGQERPGAVSFQDLRIIDGVQCPTFKAAVALGVLEDDTKHYRCLEEAAVSATASQMHALLWTS